MAAMLRQKRQRQADGNGSKYIDLSWIPSTTCDVERISSNVCKSGRTRKTIARYNGVFYPARGIAVEITREINAHIALCGCVTNGLGRCSSSGKRSRAEALDDDLPAGVVGACDVALVRAEVVGAAAACRDCPAATNMPPSNAPAVTAAAAAAR